MYDFQICTKVLPRSILILQDLRQNQSPETVPTCIVMQCFPHDKLFEFFCVMNVRDQTRQTFVTSFVHLVTARASLFTVHKVSGLPKIRATYRYFRTICEQTVDNSPTDPFSSSFQWWSSKHGVATSIHFEDQLCNCTHRGPRIVDHDVWFAVQDGWDCFLHQFFPRVRCTVSCISASLQ